MDYINASIPIHSIPKTEETELVPISPYYLKIQRLEWMITAAFFVLASSALILFIPSLRKPLPSLLIAGPALLFLLFYWVSQEKSFPFKAFAIREKDLLYRKGWLVRSLKVIPFKRIQNCSVQSGPLERKYSLATIKLFTAGSEGADLSIPGLTLEEAEKLRDFIVGQIHQEEDETN